MALARITDFTAGQPIVSAEVDAEFNQLVNALNGSSTDKDITMKLSHAANPVLTLDQLGAAAILTAKQNGTERASIRNDGQIRSAVNAAASAYIKLGGQYQQNVTEVGNTGAGADDLHSYTIAANVFGAVGDTLEIIAAGQVLAAGNNKEITFYVDGQAIFVYSDDPASTMAWTMRITITRIAADSLQTVVQFMSDQLIGGATYAIGTNTNTVGHTFSNSMIIKWTGQDADGTTNRVLQQLSIVRKFFGV